MSKSSYWPDEKFIAPGVAGCVLELRANIALYLIDSLGSATGKQNKELVDQCFAIADLFVDKAEARGEIRPVADSDAVAEAVGRYDHLRSESRYESSRVK